MDVFLIIVIYVFWGAEPESHFIPKKYYAFQKHFKTKWLGT